MDWLYELLPVAIIVSSSLDLKFQSNSLHIMDFTDLKGRISGALILLMIALAL